MQPLSRDQRGFTLIELLIASALSVVVLGAAVMIASQVQGGYRRQMEEATAEQEGRYALDWVGKFIRGAGLNEFPLLSSPSQCPSAGTVFAPIQFDPDADGVDNDIRIQSDNNPPDGKLGGPNISGGCDQANEDVTISLDAANHTIVFLDNNLGGGQSTRTDKVIEDLRFIFRDTTHTVITGRTTTDAANVVYIETDITTRTRTVEASTGVPVTRVLSAEVRVRSR